MVGHDRSEAARTIAAERMGVRVNNADVPGLVKAIVDRVASDELVQDEVARARAAFGRENARSHRTTRFARLLESLPLWVGLHPIRAATVVDNHSQ